MSRRRKKPNKPIFRPDDPAVGEWIELTRQQFEGLPCSQHEAIVEEMQTSMVRGGWTRAATAEVMRRLTPTTFPPEYESEWDPLIRTFPWLQHLNDAQRRQFLLELADAIATPPERYEPGMLTELLDTWRARAGG